VENAVVVKPIVPATFTAPFKVIFPPALKTKFKECEPLFPIVTPELETICLAASKVKVLDLALVDVVKILEAIVISPFAELDVPEPYKVLGADVRTLTLVPELRVFVIWVAAEEVII